MRGREIPQDDGMAAAAFLDASDLGHPEATLMSALLYYIGVGVTRNVLSARQYAQKYLELAPQGNHVVTAHEIINESLGTENGRRMLYGDAAQTVMASNEKAKAGSRRVVLISAGGAVAVILLIAVGIFISSHWASSLPGEKTENSSLKSNEERDQAKKDASTIDAPLKANALTVTIGEGSAMNAAEVQSSVAANTSEAQTSVSIKEVDGKQVIRAGDVVIEVQTAK